jgi:prepilin signal peptidase PulO-like enzyme (type II secretory pathway)
MIALIAWTFIYAGAATCGVIAADFVCSRIQPPENGPVPAVLHPGIPIVLFALLGLVIAARDANVGQMATIALLGIPLVAAWYSDARTGIVPDVFTLVPLAIIAIGVLVRHTWFGGVFSWGSALSAGVIFAAFALAALFSRGRGMGWGDVKLAMLVAVLLGLETSLLTLAIACFVATIVSVVRTRGKQPIAFAPYIVVSSFVAAGALFGLNVNG